MIREHTNKIPRRHHSVSEVGNLLEMELQECKGQFWAIQYKPLKVSTVKKLLSAIIETKFSQMDTQELSPSFSCPIRRYVPSLPREAMKKAETELNETDKVREKCIIKLRNWIESRPDLAIMDIGDLTLVWFLRSSKYDIDRTQKRLENYFTFRKNVPEWFSNRDPNLPELNKLFSLGCYLPLKHQDQDGRRVVLVRCCIHSPRQTVQDDVFKAGNMIQEILNRMDELISIYGVVAIFDLKGATLAHGMAMTPSIIKKAVTSWQDCVPVRIKALHFINTPYNVHIVLSIFKSFMKEKLRKRVHLHGGNLSSFHSHVPVGILPEEYGGMSGPVQELVEYWKQSAEAARDWYLEEDRYLKESVTEKNFENL